jgi:predicted NBD/HSP70 family sugar kinase
MRLGVDFGGAKIAAAGLDSKGQILARQRLPNPGEYGLAIQAVAELARRIEREAGEVAETIGVRGVMSGASSPPLRGEGVARRAVARDGWGPIDEQPHPSLLGNDTLPAERGGKQAPP